MVAAPDNAGVDPQSIRPVSFDVDWSLDLLKQVSLLCEGLGLLRANPESIEQLLAESLRLSPAHVLVCGPLSSRGVLVDSAADTSLWTNISGRSSLDAFAMAHPAIDILYRDNSGALLSIPPLTAVELRSPNVLLASLCHPDVFTLPRFSLAIADIAAAIRATFRGRVRLRDMQLGLAIKDIAATAAAGDVDIFGISATFGQQDLLEELLEVCAGLGADAPITLVGGSLPALTYRRILDRFPQTFVCTGAGEPTINAFINAWHGQSRLDAVPALMYTPAAASFFITARERRSASVSRFHNQNAFGLVGSPLLPRNAATSLATMHGPPDSRLSVVTPSFTTPIVTSDTAVVLAPELDLLDATLRAKGVMQLELARGCAFACSFCPREHKGRWQGGDSSIVKEILPFLDEHFDQYPHLARKIYLVDEEFIGYQRDALMRARALADSLTAHRFRFESMTRVDQVYRTEKPESWLLERTSFWRSIGKTALDRVLLGVESGVDSVLKRFNKQITSIENANAIRLLSACDVPMRVTYITFDPLMSLEELKDTFQFQGRHDLLLAGCTAIRDADVATSIGDDAFAIEYSAGRPLYKDIPYMLVSLEALIGSVYLTELEARELAGPFQWSMGKRAARYADPRIGILSDASQRWIDRTFDVDYLLKSLMKLALPAERQEIALLREVIKDYSYSLLGQMLFLVTNDESLLRDVHILSPEITRLVQPFSHAAAAADLTSTIMRLLDAQFSLLIRDFDERLRSIRDVIHRDAAEMIDVTFSRCAARTTWGRINDW